MLLQRQRGYHFKLPLHGKGHLWIVHLAVMKCKHHWYTSSTTCCSPEPLSSQQKIDLVHTSLVLRTSALHIRQALP